MNKKIEDQEFEQTETNRVRQVAKRGQYDKTSVHKILDASLIGQVGFNSERGPFVIPMLFARRDNELLFHGSAKSRLMQVLSSGDPLCVSATLLDGLVLAKSLFHHSMNYRSVAVFGSGYEVVGEEERMDALRIITDKVMPGRWDDARRPSQQEMKATLIAAVKIESASAKIRKGEPIDDPDDLKLPVWSGVVPIEATAGQPIGIQTSEKSAPAYVNEWITDFNSI